MIFHQVLAPLPGGISQQTGVIIQPQQILFTGNKTQVIPTTVAAPTPAQAQIPAAGQQQPQQQQAQPQAPLVLQVDGTGDTSSEEEDEEEEEYDDDEEEEKEKDGGEDGQVEEVYLLWLGFRFFVGIKRDLSTSNKYFSTTITSVILRMQLLCLYFRLGGYGGQSKN